MNPTDTLANAERLPGDRPPVSRDDEQPEAEPYTRLPEPEPLPPRPNFKAPPHVRAYGWEARCKVAESEAKRLFRLLQGRTGEIRRLRDELARARGHG